MTPDARMLIGLVLASALAYAATPVAIRVAGQLEFFDKPAGYKGHAAPTPYLGGAAVMAAFAINDGSAAVVVIVLAFLVAAGAAIAVFEAQDAALAAAEPG